MDDRELCPLCGTQPLLQCVRTDRFVFEKMAIEVKGLQYSLCVSCDVEFRSPDQLRLSKMLIVKARKDAKANAALPREVEK